MRVTARQDVLRNYSDTRARYQNAQRPGVRSSTPLSDSHGFHRVQSAALGGRFAGFDKLFHSEYLWTISHESTG